jgi:ABC-type antimicrobial peptide transport system permease subunit
VQSLAARRDRLTRILIEPRSGREASVMHALLDRFGGTLNARRVDTEAQLLGDAAGPERQVTLLFSAISLVAGVILAFNALLLARDERRRFITNLIEMGTPDSMIVASLAFDAFILGMGGAAIGLLVGDVVSLVAYRSVPGYIAAAFSLGGQRVVGTQTVLIALAGGMAAAFAAAALPAISILRSSSAEELGRASRTLSLVDRLRFSDSIVFATGLLLLASSVATSVLWPKTTVIALVA